MINYANLLFLFFADDDFFPFSVSGLSGSAETAQSQVSVGMGLLAGSTVMLLTVIWGSCVIVGKCDLQDNLAKDNQDTKGFSLTGLSQSLPHSMNRLTALVYVHAGDKYHIISRFMLCSAFRV